MAPISRRKFVFLILPKGKVVRVLLLQCIKEKVNGIFETFVILPDLHSIYHFHQSGKVLLVCRGLIIDIADQRRIQQRLGLDPEIIAGFSFPFGVCDQHRYQFQNIFLIVDVSKRVVMHTF